MNRRDQVIVEPEVFSGTHDVVAFVLRSSRSVNRNTADRNVVETVCRIITQQLRSRTNQTFSSGAVLVGPSPEGATCSLIEQASTVSARGSVLLRHTEEELKSKGGGRPIGFAVNLGSGISQFTNPQAITDALDDICSAVMGLDNDARAIQVLDALSTATAQARDAGAKIAAVAYKSESARPHAGLECKPFCCTDDVDLSSRTSREFGAEWRITQLPVHVHDSV